ncbi:MAG TPA: carboxypeptidase-like regulatory domain-containing protein [Planctomycetota bacterium]|nr:carboxypeptidase-like regulatory domain-containing protein [Planctomycetota bacterium]
MTHRKWIIPLTVALIVVGVAAALMVRGLKPERGYSRTAAAPAPNPSLEGLEATGSLDAAGAAASAATIQGGSVEQGRTAEAGAYLHGKVANEDGVGLSGAAVLVVAGAGPAGGADAGAFDFEVLLRERLLGRAPPDRPTVVAEAAADSTGSYRIPLSSIPPGSYAVLARHPPEAPHKESWVWTPESSELNFHLGPGEGILGIVLDLDGNPIPDAVVEAASDEGQGGPGRGFGRRPSLEDRTVTDAEGRFALRVSPGSFRLTSSAKGFTRASVDDVRAGSEDVAIALPPGRNLAGRVTEEKGLSIAGARLSLFRATREEGGGFQLGGFGGRGGFGGGGRGGAPARLQRLFRSPEAHVESDEEGKFLFTDLSPGRHLILVERQGFMTTDKDVEISEELDTASVDIALAPGSVLRGVVTDPAGEPVPRALVVVSEDSGRERGERRGPPGGGEDSGGRERGERRGPPGAGEESGRAREDRDREDRGQRSRSRRFTLVSSVAAVETDAAGQFAIDTLPSGAYSLLVQSEDFVPHEQEKLILADALDVSVVLDPGIQLEGLVTSAVTGAPVPRARVQMSLEDNARRRTETDADGRYRLSGLLAERVESVEINAPGFARLIEDGPEIAESPGIQSKDFQLAVPAVLSGIVTDMQGEPVPRARLTVGPAAQEVEGQDPDWQGMRRRFGQTVQARTDTEGRFSGVEVEASAALEVVIRHPDFKDLRSSPFSVTPGSRREDLRFQLHAGARVEVTVLDAGGSSLPGARVLLARAREETDGPGDGGRGEGNRGDRRGGRGRMDGMRNGTTGPDGKVVFGGLDGGSFTVTASLRGYQRQTVQTVLVEDRLTSVMVHLPLENVLSGIVMDREGRPIERAQVQAFPASRGEGLRGEGFNPILADGGMGVSDAGGAFRLGSLGEGPYSVRVRREGYTEVFIEAAQVNRPLSIVMPRLGGIAGFVRTEETGMPVVAFTIRLRADQAGGVASAVEPAGPGGPRGGFRGGRGGRGGQRRSFNDPNGAFAWNEIEPGIHVLEVTAEGRSGAEVRVEVVEGAVTERIDVLLIEGLSLNGVVALRGTASPVAGAEIFLIPVVEPANEAPGREGRDGGAGERREERDRRRAERLDRDQGGSRSETAETLLAGMTATAIQSAMRGGGSLAVTDGSGAFQLKEVPEGRYLLLVNHEAYVPGRQAVRIDGVVRSVRVDLDPGETLTGTVSLQDGSAAAGATIMLRDSNGITKRTQADSVGRYSLQGLVPGTYTLSLRSATVAAGAGRAQVEIKEGSNRFDYRVGMVEGEGQVRRR